jgi:hypothetical protein
MVDIIFDTTFYILLNKNRICVLLNKNIEMDLTSSFKTKECIVDLFTAGFKKRGNFLYYLSQAHNT